MHSILLNIIFYSQECGFLLQILQIEKLIESYKRFIYMFKITMIK